MGKVIRLTESDLSRIVRRVIKESEVEDDEFIYLDEPKLKDYGWNPDEEEVNVDRYKNWKESPYGKRYQHHLSMHKDKHNKSMEHILSLPDDELDKYMSDAKSEYDRKYPHKNKVGDFHAWLRGRKK
jgi:hypothetical protein